MSGGGSQQSLRKYLGTIKDTTTVGIAKVNSDYKDLDISIVKATNHHERPAKEKHIRAIFAAISASRPRADVAYCIHALAKRLAKTHNWAAWVKILEKSHGRGYFSAVTGLYPHGISLLKMFVSQVALKTLIVIHRAMREVDHTFREELINYGRSRNHMLNMAHFKDDSSANAWDYSAWVRTYALFLEERLECFRVLKYDVETDPPRNRELDTSELLEQLPALQQLLFRVLGCQPQGAATHNFVIQLALSMVAGESIKIHQAIDMGTLNLVDKFFEMQRHDAVRALDIYRRAVQQAERLSEFYEVCKSIDLRRGEGFPKIQQPTPSFLTAMEEYVKDAPRASTVRKDQLTSEKPKMVLAIEHKKTAEVQEPPKPPTPPPEPANEPDKPEAPVLESSDLLGLSDPNPDASDLENKNAMALAIVPVEDVSTTPASSSSNLENGTTGWELALVTVPSSNTSASSANKLAGGLDKLTLDSLYDDAIRRANQTRSYSPWEQTSMAGPSMQQPVIHDPFHASSAISAPPSVQMAAMAQQQHAFMMQQQMMMMGQQPQHVPANPFGNPYATGVSPYGPGAPSQPSNTYRGLI